MFKDRKRRTKAPKRVGSVAATAAGGGGGGAGGSGGGASGGAAASRGRVVNGGAKVG